MFHGSCNSFQSIPVKKSSEACFVCLNRPLLLENGDYEESESKQVIDQVTACGELIANEFRESVLPTVHLEAQSEQSTFASFGQNLINGFNRILKDKNLVSFNSNT